MHFNFKNKISSHSVSSLQGTLAKRTRPTLQTNFAKEPFRPSRSKAELRDSANMIDKKTESKNRQCLMYIQNRRDISILKGCSPLQNCNGLISSKPAIAYFAYTQRQCQLYFCSRVIIIFNTCLELSLTTI
jgi:hypothetical protein